MLMVPSDVYRKKLLSGFSGAGNVHSGPHTRLVLSSTHSHNSSGLPHLANSGCPYLKTCPVVSVVSDRRCLVAVNNYPKQIAL